MKYSFNCKKFLTIILSLIIFTNLSSQNSEQTRSFVNRTHMAIAKVQKEMLRSGKNNFDAELKKAMKYQVIALRLYKENKLKDAVGYSYKARSQSLELLNTLSKPAVERFDLNEDEKTFCKASDFTSLALKPGLIDAAETKKIEELDVMNIQKFLEIELNIK